jgi:hypothetical protein
MVSSLHSKTIQDRPALNCKNAMPAYTIEDDLHLFWLCPYAQRLWQWLYHLNHVQSATPWTQGTEHALLEEALPCDI